VENKILIINHLSGLQTVFLPGLPEKYGEDTRPIENYNSISLFFNANKTKPTRLRI
jgi:hypothetical protein